MVVLDQFDIGDEDLIGPGATGLALQLTVSGNASAGVSGSGTLKLLRLTNAADQSWLGVEAADLNFGLDFAPLSLAVTDGTLLLNQAPAGETKLDWASMGLLFAGVPFVLSDTVDWANTNLRVSGDAAIDFDGLLSVEGNFVLDQFAITDDGLIGAGATGLALQLTVNGDASAGVSGSGTLKLLRLTNAMNQSWLGVEATDLSFGLNFAPVEFAVTNGTLLLNQAPIGESKLNWGASSILFAGAPFALSELVAWAIVDFSVFGDTIVSIDDVLSVEGSFALEQFDLADNSVVPGSATALAVELSIVGNAEQGSSASGNLNLLRVSDSNGQSWLGVEATDLNIDLDFSPLQLKVIDGHLRFNQSSVGGSKLDWSTITASGNTAGFNFEMGVDASTDFSISGNALIDVDGLLSVEGSFTLDQFDVTDDSIIGAGAKGIAFQMSASSDIGASGDLKLLRLTNASGQNWLGVEATDLSFSLNFAPLTSR